MHPDCFARLLPAQASCCLPAISLNIFIDVLQERLKQQREEAKSNPEYRDEFKPKMSKEDQKGRRKQILSSIGAWLWPLDAS